MLQVGDRDLLEDVSWRLMPGSRVGLVGANGAGKSTLLRCLTGVRQVRTCLAADGPKKHITKQGSISRCWYHTPV